MSRSMQAGGPRHATSYLSEETRYVEIDMTRPHLEDLPPVSVPNGYRLVTLADDEVSLTAWANLVNTAFEGYQNWTPESIQEGFLTREQHDLEGTFFVMCGDEPVSCAFAWTDEAAETQLGRVHWVATRPDHRRKGLARAVVLAVLHRFRQRGFARAFLGTHTPLLLAIQMYLSMGFEPTPHDEEHQKAWAEIMEKLRRHDTASTPLPATDRRPPDRDPTP